MYSHQIEPYLKLLLQAMDCKNVSVSSMNDDELVCGFSNEMAVMQDIARIIEPNRVFKVGTDQYLLTFSKVHVSRVLEKNFREWMSYTPGGLVGYYDHELGFVLNDSEIKHAKSGRLDRQFTYWRAGGVDMGWGTKPSHSPKSMFPHSDPYQSMFPSIPSRLSNITYHYLRIYSIEKFFNKTFSKESLNKKREERSQREIILQGIESKESSVAAWKKNELFDRNVLKLVFQFHAPLTEPKEIKIEQGVNEALSPPQLADMINKISTAVQRLNNEIKETYDPLKESKRKFLKLVLTIKNTNPTFSLQWCAHLAKTLHPELYKEAIKGFTSRTEKLLDEIQSLSVANRRSRVAL